MEPDGPRADAAMFLQLGSRAEASPVEVPVHVQNLDGEVITLEVSQLLPGVRWDELPGRAAKLRLTQAGKADRVVAGTIVWAYTSGDSALQMILGLELPNLEAAVEQLILAQMGLPAEDIRDLWDRWDQVRSQSRSSLPPTATYLVGGAVIVAGLFLQHAGKVWLEMLGYMFMVASSMVLAARICGLWGKQG